MTVRQLLNNLDSYEMSEWMVYYKIKNEKKQESPNVVAGQIKAGFPMHGKRKHRL